MDYKKEIVNTIQHLSGKHSQYQIFRDWCEMFALAIANSSVLIHDEVWKYREEAYMNLWKKYDDNEHEEILYMSNILPLVYEQKFTDVLGEIYMESGCGNSATGQFFTPFHVSEMMARLNSDEYINADELKLYEPSVGGGGMMIAIAKVLKENNINYQKKMKVTAQDLDWLAVYMSYIQLSLLGIDAVVIQGDSLKNEYVEKRRVLKSPKHMGVLI